MKKGLVLEGGAMRGLFSAGVVDVLLENDIRFDGAMGVSAGATFGVNFKSKQKGRVLRYTTTYANDERFSGLQSWLKTGDLYGAEFCYDTIPNELDPFHYEQYRKNPMAFYVVVTNVESGEAEYIEIPTLDEKEMLYLRASASMPIVSKIVKIDGNGYLDGGIADSIPIKAMEKLGYEKNVVILTRPLYYRKKKQAFLKGMHLLFEDYPNIVKALENSADAYNETLAYIQRKESKGELFVIRPEFSLKVGKVEHNSEALKEAYEEGKKNMQARLEELKAFLDK